MALKIHAYSLLALFLVASMAAGPAFPATTWKVSKPNVVEPADDLLMGVSIAPGAYAFTVIPCAPNSNAEPY